ncbi:MAG: low molecular weight phosphotyrosine protein phosphatase [Chitinophagaceae bacterium]|nr:MAG: low molecular weight phosphotyrosine protein phosphatase [Chitinophagaceae bacterium]
MVCLGNICRSPLAEGVLQHKADALGLNWQVDSAGTNQYHIGEPPHRSSQKVAKENGIDISKQRARKFIPEDFDHYDKIYVMATDVWRDVKYLAGNKFDKNKIDYFLNELYPGENQDVFDPWYGTEKDFVSVFDQINQTADAIIKKYNRNL